MYSCTLDNLGISQYVSRVANYNRIAFIRLATGITIRACEGREFSVKLKRDQKLAGHRDVAGGRRPRKAFLLRPEAPVQRCELRGADPGQEQVRVEREIGFASILYARATPNRFDMF